MPKPILIFFLFLSGSVFAQQNLRDSLTQNLAPVEVKAGRLTISETKAPFAVTVIDKYRIQTATQQLSMYENLASIAGVFAMNPDNFSQDLRISIRGFGSRAAFGIRGIRIFTDGLPEGTPDGQVDVDNIDMGAIQQMEVIRGAASGIYGNASGGIIYLTTESPTLQKIIGEFNQSFGNYGFSRNQVKAGQKFKKFSYFVNLSHNKTTGYRAWSEMENAIMNAKFIFELSPKTKLTALVNIGNSPVANDAGGLTAEQMKENPRQAAATNLLFETGEIVNQRRIGVVFETKPTDNQTFTARVFGTSRNLTNRLAVASNGFGDLARIYYGTGFSYQLNQKIATKPYRLKIGFDFENQHDDRQRFAYLKTIENNVTHYKQDKLALAQFENFRSIGCYILQDFQPTKQLTLTIGGRFDNLALALNDRFLADGDQSDNLTFNKVNPTLGINYEFKKHISLYSNFATSFETPTLNELSNNPEGTGGFNPNLKPQQAKSFEIGTKVYLFSKLKYDIAAFNIETINDLVPYQITGQGTKTYYRNAGKTHRKGIEISANYQISKGFTAYFTHTFSDFKYVDYTANNISYAGKYLPAIPKNNTQLELRYAHPKGFWASLQARKISKLYANDANTTFANAYQTIHLKMAYTVKIKRLTYEPYLSINNLTNSHFVGNLLINASNNRYFEPALPRYFFGGIKIRV